MTAPSIRRLRRQASALVAVLAACSTLAACGAGSSAPKEEQPILTKKSVVEIWKDYDKLNNAALVKTGPPSYDASAFGVVDVGPILDEDFTRVKLAKIERTKRSKPFSHTPKALYSPVKSAGFALSSTLLPGYKGWESLACIVQTGDPATWKQELSVDARVRDLPRPLEPGRRSTANEADVERAREAVTSVSEYWRTLRKPSGIALGVAVQAEFVEAHAASRSGKLHARSEILLQGISRTPGAGEALRVVRAQGGLLVLANVRLRSTLDSHREDFTIKRNGVLAKLFGGKPVNRSRQRYSSSLAISVPDKGKPKVIGAMFVPLVK